MRAIRANAIRADLALFAGALQEREQRGVAHLIRCRIVQQEDVDPPNAQMPQACLKRGLGGGCRQIAPGYFEAGSSGALHALFEQGHCLEDRSGGTSSHADHPGADGRWNPVLCRHRASSRMPRKECAQACFRFAVAVHRRHVEMTDARFIRPLQRAKRRGASHATHDAGAAVAEPCGGSSCVSKSAGQHGFLPARRPALPRACGPGALPMRARCAWDSRSRLSERPTRCRWRGSGCRACAGADPRRRALDRST